MIKIHIAKFQTGAPARAVLDVDMSEFQRIEPYGYTLNVHRAIEFNSRWYTLTNDCPDDGYAVWTPAVTPEEEAREAAILAARSVLTAQQIADIGGEIKDFKTREERITQKLLDDIIASENL